MKLLALLKALARKRTATPIRAVYDYELRGTPTRAQQAVLPPNWTLSGDPWKDYRDTAAAIYILKPIHPLAHITNIIIQQGGATIAYSSWDWHQKTTNSPEYAKTGDLVKLNRILLPWPTRKLQNNPGCN